MTILMSFQPKHANLILKGDKIVEVRRNLPRIPSGVQMFIYSTHPIQSIIGTVEISTVRDIHIIGLWENYRTEACMTEAEFEKYSKDWSAGKGCVIELKNPVRFEKPIRLGFLKARIKFTAPQSWMYANGKIINCIKEYRKASYAYT